VSPTQYPGWGHAIEPKDNAWEEGACYPEKDGMKDVDSKKTLQLKITHVYHTS
jgi:hypothetical protein